MFCNSYIAGPYLGFLSKGRGGGGGANSAHLSGRGLPYTDRVSSWKFLFSPLHRKLPLRRLKRTKHTEFTSKGDLFSQLVDFLVISDQYRYKK